MVTELKLSKLSEQKRIRLAQSTTNPKILTILANYGKEYTRECVAANPNTPKDVLTVLASEADPNLHRKVAENPNTPANILAVLAADQDEYVRGRVASNSNTPAAALTLLASDVNDYVRQLVATNFAVFNELLWCLLTDPDEDVVDDVTERLEDRNIPLTDPSWVDLEVLRTIYVTLQTNNLLNTPILTQLLKAKITLTQPELIELCELYDSDVHKVIKTKYELTHPLLKQILSPKHTPIIPSATIRR